MSTAGSLALFDIDGTLMRGAGSHHKLALVEGVRRATGRGTSLDGVPTAGTLDRDLITEMLRTAGESERSIQRILRAAMGECASSYLENCPGDLSPFLCTGVVATLAALRARGVVLGLVTGNLTRIGWKKMELAGLADFFSVGAFAEDGRSRTRLAQVAFWRARRLKLVGKNSRVSLIGDHASDVRAAKANGFLSIAVATGVMQYEDLAATGPAILLHHLGELDVTCVSG